MAWWIYKCNAKKWRGKGDWNEFDPKVNWGSTRLKTQLKDLAPGDKVIAYQTDRNELVGVTKVKEFRGPYLYLEPLEEIRAKVRPLKADPKVDAIPALTRHARTTLFSMSAAEAQTLLRAARRAK